MTTFYKYLQFLTLFSLSSYFSPCWHSDTMTEEDPALLNLSKVQNLLQHKKPLTDKNLWQSGRSCSCSCRPHFSESQLNGLFVAQLLFMSLIRQTHPGTYSCQELYWKFDKIIKSLISQTRLMVFATTCDASGKVSPKLYAQCLAHFGVPQPNCILSWLAIVWNSPPITQEI